MILGSKILLYFFILPVVITAAGKNSNYAVSKISETLKKNADAVIRIDYSKFEIKSKDRAYLTVKKAVTIFKKTEEDYGMFHRIYDKFQEIEELEGHLYDADGNEIRELESKDIKDYSIQSDYTFYSDSRVKTAELFHNIYPYTVEFIYEVSFDGYLNFPDWYSRHSIDPVERSYFEIITSDQNLRYWCNSDSIKPFITSEGNKTKYLWQALNQPKLSRDVIGEYIEDVAAMVKIAPSQFEIDGYAGNMNSWKEFGLWYSRLCNKRDRLPEKALNEIASLYGAEESVSEKVSKLFTWFQKHTRYVSIQLGIGGWQPYDAEFVYNRGYGDCKALVNYMHAILTTAGIKSYPVLINNGKHRYPMITEFSSNQFNHVILSVPYKDDTLWLECTSQSAPVGYIGAGNENRHALMITDEGGVVISTPKSTSTDNLQLRNAEVRIKSDGTAQVLSSVKFYGNNRGYVQNIIEEYTPEDQHKWVLNSMDNPGCRINVLKFATAEDKSLIDLMLNLDLPRYANVSNNRIFFNPNMMERKTTVPNDVSKRLSPVIFSYPYKDIDTLIYELPDGYKIESLPVRTNLETSFCSFMSEARLISDKNLMYIRNFEIKDYIIPAEEYSSYRKLYVDIVKADRSMVVLVKK